MKYANLYKNIYLKPKPNNIYTYKHKTMNQSALQLFVRSIIAEAKEKKAKDEPKKAAKKAEPKKAEKKESKKSSSNLVEMKKDLAALKEKSSKIDDLIGEWEQMKNSAENMSYGGEQDIEIGADLRDSIIEDCNKEIEKLKKEKESIDKEIADLKENTTNEINKIKEMMGLTSEKKEKGQEKIVGEKLKPSMGAGAYVKDFEKSKAPQFKGKSKEKKDKMAVAAYLSAKDKK